MSVNRESVDAFLVFPTFCPYVTLHFLRCHVYWAVIIRRTQ